MKYLDEIYLGEGIETSELVQLLELLNNQPNKAKVYVLALSTNEYDQLDIYHSKYLMQRFYQKNPPYIIGIARKHEDAIALVEKIVQECVTKRGDANLKAYLIGE